MPIGFYKKKNVALMDLIKMNILTQFAFIFDEWQKNKLDKYWMFSGSVRICQKNKNQKQLDDVM